MQTESSSGPRPLADRMPIRRWMVALAWALVSFFAFIGVPFALLPPVGQFEQIGVPHGMALGIWALAWVLGTGMLVLVAARIAFGAWLTVFPGGWLVLLVGAVVSSANLWVVVDWSIARYGASDPEYIGPTVGLFAVVAAVAVAGFGVQVAPPWAVWAPVLAVGGGLLLGVSILLTNVSGLTDGLAPDSGLLAGASIAAAVYVGVVAIVSVMRLRRA